MVIELGHQYARFHIMGLTLMNGASPYEIVTPWAHADLFDLRYVQSADVMTFTHPAYPPQELRRFGALDWRIEATDFAPTAPPAGVSATATVAASMPPSITYSYVVTRVRDGDGSESTASAASSVTNNLFVTGNKFQSAPAIAGGRCPRRSSAATTISRFNPRPPLLAGDAS